MCLGTASRRKDFAMGYIGATDASILRSEASTINLETAEINPSEPTKKPQSAEFHDASEQSKVWRPQPTSFTKVKGEHIIVQHDYHDHSLDRHTDYQEEHPARGGVCTPFPLKLHEMLDDVREAGHEDIVSWQPHGRCFVVHKPREFVELLPAYFKLSKLPSFQRQLNLYGFQRLTRGRDRGGYYHELFLRGKVFLAHSIQRIKVKGTGVRARSNPDQEPNFWGMPWINDANTIRTTSAAALQSSHMTVPPIQFSPSDGTTFLPPPMIPSISLSSVESSSMSTRYPNKLPHSADVDNLYTHGSLVDEDILCAFGNKTFHYLDPFQSLSMSDQQQEEDRNQKQDIMLNSMMNLFEKEELLNAEAESFFEDFQFPDDIGSGIEDDVTFGEMLESLIA